MWNELRQQILWRMINSWTFYESFWVGICWTVHRPPDIPKLLGHGMGEGATDYWYSGPLEIRICRVNIAQTLCWSELDISENCLWNDDSWPGTSLHVGDNFIFFA